MSKREPNEDRILEHDYDGIQEYDNPMPAWWVWIFWATIVYSVLYAVNIPGIGIGKGRIAAYEAEMARSASRRAAADAASAPAALTDAQIVALTRDPARVAAGKAIFATRCAPCHQPDGGGLIGPNLTDDFWIHGNQPTQILGTVSVGVLDKGMPSWSAQLKPADIQSVVAFVLTLHGTKPATAKEPQGQRLPPWTESAEAR
jgi:cytochrome c oxidase cbb3-type subunit 3